METVQEENDRLQGNSNEYEPWQNAGVESVCRILPAEMRKLHVRSGVPFEFWNFSAIVATLILRWTRERRDGKSCGELFGRKKIDINKYFRVWGCRVVARKPIPWRDGKLDERRIDCVYCGKARNKQGYYGWHQEYGLVTSTQCTCIT